MKEKFPQLMVARYEPYDAISISFCQSSEPEHQEFCDQTKENLNKQFEKLLGVWSYLYSQCSKGIRPEDCIAQIDISRCSESVVGKYENWIGLEAGPGACYGLAAFLKKSISICENQFYYIDETNCGYWVEYLSKDCSSCNEQSFVENDQGYFNWLEGATPSMRQVGSCEAMVNQSQRDTCFRIAATSLKNEEYCERVSKAKYFSIQSAKETRREMCYGDVASATGKEELCDKIITNSQRRDLCHSWVKSQKDKQRR